MLVLRGLCYSWELVSALALFLLGDPHRRSLLRLLALALALLNLTYSTSTHNCTHTLTC